MIQLDNPEEKLTGINIIPVSSFVFFIKQISPSKFNETNKNQSSSFS